ncbi:DNA-binding response regulator [Psychrobacillus glaciei]|uniref:DNA-binding response regulator n=1 Tax=Psychrobacillus glaciei TaxID=2283160 RepID=A0A5J6SM46_9BACI|nr:response regulator transcription factor [Psychrobacillus glaciei]QFF97844.1 DNA-binding response regulator [Psychrobacillus glaciei]
MSKKVLIVEDQAIVRQGLRMMIDQNNDFTVVAEASNGKEAISALELYAIDIVLLDIRMPEMNGVEATKRIKKRWPQVKILILTTFDDDEYAIQTLKDGASGFMLKTAEPTKLIAAIHSILSGGLVLNEEVAAKMMPRLLEKNSEPTITHTLTAREIDILKLVGEGKTNKEIAEALFLSIGTVKNHITHILQQLELRDRTQLAIYAVKNNLV